MIHTLYAHDDDAGRRLDRILRKTRPELPISAIHRMLRKGAVKINGKSAAADRRVDAGDAIQFEIKNELYNSIEAKTDAPENNNTTAHSSLIKKNILFENNTILIINKSAGVVVHGGDSLESAVTVYLKDKIPPSLSFKPGPLHRLDRETSGAIIFSKSLSGARYISEGFQKRLFCKTYIAIAEGVIEHEDIWYDTLIRDKSIKKTFLGKTEKSKTPPTAAKNKDSGIPPRRDAITKITPLASNGYFTLIKVEIKTGRTHQIRAAAAAHGHALSGDKKYGGGASGETMFLHSYSIEFPGSDITGIEKITAPPPESFKRKIKTLFPGFDADSLRG
jgi:23S rRNA pseudouridine955/2504/2580 synthase